MKFGQLIEYNKRNIIFQKLCSKWGRETSSGLLLFFGKTWYEVKQVAAAYFWSILMALNLPFNQSKLYDIKQKQFRRISSSQNQNMTWKQDIKVNLIKWFSKVILTRWYSVELFLSYFS